MKVRSESTISLFLDAMLSSNISRTVSTLKITDPSLVL
jgi:hypothetical protein